MSRTEALEKLAKDLSAKLADAHLDILNLEAMLAEQHRAETATKEAEVVKEN